MDQEPISHNERRRPTSQPDRVQHIKRAFATLCSPRIHPCPKHLRQAERDTTDCRAAWQRAASHRIRQSHSVSGIWVLRLSCVSRRHQGERDQLPFKYPSNRAECLSPHQLQWTGDPESPPRSEVDDISFVNFLITKLQSEYSIDATRIYVAGFSNGGGLTDLLACDPTASGRVAAFAISSGAFYTDGALKEPLFSQCHPSRSPVPILEFHGSKDPVIHYDGKTTPDGETYNVLKWVKGWAKRNGCTVEDSKPTPEFDGKVERYSWSRDGKEVVVHYHIDGFGHGWPSTYPLNNDEQRHGPTYFNGTPVVLDFFRKFSLGKGSESQTVGNR